MLARTQTKRILTLALALVLLLGCISPVAAFAEETEFIEEMDSTSQGIAALLILSSAGVVYTPEDDTQIAAFGDAMSTYLTQWGVDNDKSDVVESWLQGISINVDGGNDSLYIPDDAKDALASWTSAVILGESVVSYEGETAPDGYKYYNGVLLLDPGSKYTLICERLDNGRIDAFCPGYSLKCTGNYLQCSGYYYISVFEVGGTSWSTEQYFSLSESSAIVYLPINNIIWCSQDIYNADGLYRAADGPAIKVLSESVTCDSLLGDVALGIQAGTHTVDDIVIPSYIDVDSALNYSGTSGTASVQQMLQDVSSGDLTYDGLKDIVVTEGSSITGIDISRTPTWCYAGLSIGIAVDITGTGDFDQNCTCIVEGGTSDGTFITLDTTYDTPNLYYLYVGADETAETLTVKVTSVQDSTVSATHTVTVEQLPEPTETTPETEPETETPEGEEPIPTEENPTEPATDSGTDSSDTADEKEEAESSGNSSVEDLTEVIPDYSEGFIVALQDFAGAMSYTGTEAKLKIPAVMFPQLGDLVPGFQMMEEMELDFETYVGMMPENLMTLVRSLFTVALIVFCFKELYGTISYALTLKGGAG